jgi:hypothetical protein
MEQIEDHPLVTFLPLDLTNPNSIENVLSHIDNTMQYGEDEEPREVGASPVCSRLPASLPRFTEGTGVDCISFFHGKRNVKLTVSSSISLPHRIRMTAFPIASPTHPSCADTRLKRAFHYTLARLPTALLSPSPHCVNGGPQPLLYFKSLTTTH